MLTKPLHQQRSLRKILAAPPLEVEDTGCSCQHCRQCRDELRWERVFNEKFADPTYYDRKPPRRSSTLDIPLR